MNKYLYYFIILAVVIGYIECRINYKCENTTYRINCFSGNVINIANAFWGRDNKTYCLDRNTTVKQQCRMTNVTNVIGNLCNNNRSCTINVNSATFGDPCPGVPKYLSVDYFCQKPKDCTYSKYACQNNTINIYCSDEGTVINISNVFYGRDNLAYCRFGNKRQLCSLPNATAIVSKKCNGHNFCSITANGTDFPDPCPKVPKYIKISYSCNPLQCPKNEHLESGYCDCGDSCPRNRICPLFCIKMPTCTCNYGLLRNYNTHICVNASQCPGIK